MSELTCWPCGQDVELVAGQWAAARACPDPDGHWVGCVQDMGAGTDCGEAATEVRDGFGYCAGHARIIDALDALAASTPDDPATERIAS